MNGVSRDAGRGGALGGPGVVDITPLPATVLNQGRRSALRPPDTDGTSLLLRNCTLEHLAGVAINEGQAEVGGALTQATNDPLAVLGIVRGGPGLW